MMAPSEATLKKFLYDWDNKEGKKDAPPVRIRWGGELQASLKEDAPPAPITRSKAPIPANEVAGGLAAGQVPNLRPLIHQVNLLPPDSPS